MAEEFKVQDGSLLEPVHAGDRVTVSVAESGSAKTVTKLLKQTTPGDQFAGTRDR